MSCSWLYLSPDFTTCFRKRSGKWSCAIKTHVSGNEKKYSDIELASAAPIRCSSPTKLGGLYSPIQAWITWVCTWVCTIARDIPHQRVCRKPLTDKVCLGSAKIRITSRWDPAESASMAKSRALRPFEVLWAGSTPRRRQRRTMR